MPARPLEIGRLRRQARSDLRSSASSWSVASVADEDRKVMADQTSELRRGVPAGASLCMSTGVIAKISVNRTDTTVGNTSDVKLRFALHPCHTAVWGGCYHRVILLSSGTPAT